MIAHTKEVLLQKGERLMRAFCNDNNLPETRVQPVEVAQWRIEGNTFSDEQVRTLIEQSMNSDDGGKLQIGTKKFPWALFTSLLLNVFFVTFIVMLLCN